MKRERDYKKLVHTIMDTGKSKSAVWASRLESFRIASGADKVKGQSAGEFLLSWEKVELFSVQAFN